MGLRRTVAGLLRLLLRGALLLALVSPSLASATDEPGLPDNSSRPIRIAAFGDTMMGSDHPEERLPPDDGATIFDSVRNFWKDADIVVGNLEGPFLDGGTPSKCDPKRKNKLCFEFRTPARYASHLASAGVNAMNLSNNHLLDFGSEGADSTVEILSDVGIQPVGGDHVARFTIRGTKVAILGFSYSPVTEWSLPLLDLAQAAKAVTEAKAENDLVVVSFHGGAEGATALHLSDAEETFAGTARGNSMAFAKAVVAAGADLVIGHGPHVVRAMQVVDGKLVAYSLGNFVAYGRFNLKGPSGISGVLTANIDPATGKFLGGRFDPVDLRPYGIPLPDPEKKAVKLMAELTAKDIVSPGIAIGDDGTIRPLDIQPPSLR